MCRALVLLCLSLLGSTADASVELTFHSYIHGPSGQPRTVLHLAKYKRGLFFGSCGPSTRSLQWEYSIELKGQGPDYAKQEIEVKDGDFKVLALDSGSVRMHPNKRSATISLFVKQSHSVQPFAGNGAFKIKKHG